MPLLSKAPMALAATGSGPLNLEIHLPGPVPASPPPKGGEGKTGYDMDDFAIPGTGWFGRNREQNSILSFLFR